MKRIVTFFKLDMILSSRDSMLVYSLVSPILLAVIFRLVLPSVQEVSLTFAVDEHINPVVIERLEEYGSVELFDGKEALVERVKKNDDVPGLTAADSGYTIILEGNEDEESAAGFSAILSDATDNLENVQFKVKDLKGPPPPYKEYAAVMMAMLSLFVGGVLAGFNIVDEKETKTIRALAVSPLGMLEYIGARSILAVIIGLITGFTSALILLGMEINVGMLAAGLIVSFFVALPFGFIIGAFADNQMTAFALIKLLMAVFLTLPFISIFVPHAWQWIFYILPNYWMFLVISNSLMEGVHIGFGLSAVLTAATGCGMIGLLLPKLRAGLKLR